MNAAPSVIEPQVAASAFDSVAAEYDAVFTDSRIGRAQRSAVWADLAKVFRPGDRILEIGCGTGVDACFLAERGVSVVACDSSREMIRLARARATSHLSRVRNSSVSFHYCAAEQLAQFAAYGPFDGAFSNFGGLNCVSDIGDIIRTLSLLLRPSARVLFCLMGPCCGWEFLWFAAHGDLTRATRRFHRDGTIAKIGDQRIRVRYPTLWTLCRAFAPEFRLRAVKGIGLFVPPTSLAACVNRFPRALEAAAALDRTLGRCPGIRMLADHILLTLERKNPVLWAKAEA